jgi:dienelactone hydrolase
MTRRRWLASAAGLSLQAGEVVTKKPVRPAGVEDVLIRSSSDGEQQPAWFLPPKSGAAAPLVVHLHSWSAHYNTSNETDVAVQECAARGWGFVSPEFRGPNNRPQACGSRLAIQDVLDSVDYVRGKARIDAARIYLLGGSGGGHMTLMMAARAPHLWAAASAWVPISDLAAWYRFSKQQGSRYWEMLERCCGGAPGASAEVDLEYRNRSPLFHLANAAGLPLSIEDGIHDGHTGSVPVSESLHAFNVLAAANRHADRQIAPEAIEAMTKHEKIPAGLSSEPAPEPDRKRRALFRRTAGPARVTVFEGGHETDFATAIRWLALFTKRTN